MKMLNGLQRVFLLGLLLLSLNAASQPEKALEERVGKSVRTWSATNKIGVTDDVVQSLTKQAAAAVDDVASKNRTVSRASLERVAPRAAADHLARIQDDGKAPSVAGLMEQYSTNAGVLFTEVTNFPTLTISMTPATPADFSISIDGMVFNGGLTKFRVAAKKLEVVIFRAGKAVCKFAVDMRPGEFVTEACPRP